MTMLLILAVLGGILGTGTVIWLILRGKSGGQEPENIDERYNCPICDERDCECHREEDSENTSQNASDES